jgi:hypothetical protein
MGLYAASRVAHSAFALRVPLRPLTPLCGHQEAPPARDETSRSGASIPAAPANQLGVSTCRQASECNERRRSRGWRSVDAPGTRSPTVDVDVGAAGPGVLLALTDPSPTLFAPPTLSVPTRARNGWPHLRPPLSPPCKSLTLSRCTLHAWTRRRHADRLLEKHLRYPLRGATWRPSALPSRSPILRALVESTHART